MTRSPASPTTLPRIRLIRREETTLRLGGHGDNWHMSWGADDRLFAALCDGTGWIEPSTRYYNSRLFALRGGPQEAVFEDVPAYPMLATPVQERTDPRYYCFGTLALEERIYQFLSTFNHPLYRPEGSLSSDLRFVGAKLIYSPDNGRTWCNQDGSTPVVWESWEGRSRETLVFLEEDKQAFSLLTVLQMGKSYEHNRDGYIYVYAPNGNTDGTMNELVMFRVVKDQILNRKDYEYFAGLRSDGSAQWSKDIQARGIVHTFPRGWVNTQLHPYAWQPSVVYNAPLGLYLMANWGMGCAPDGNWFGKPSYLGFWIAAQPWGPWRQIHEEAAWMPAHDPGARAYQPQISPKWIAADGKSFWLVWTDFQLKDEGEDQRLTEENKRITTHEEKMRWRAQWRRNRPYYAFNTQRVDLVFEGAAS